jgi:hypothetical protein
MKATHGTRSSFGDSMHKRHQLKGFVTLTYTKNLSYNPLKPEHEATGWVSWVDSTTCKYELSILRSGASNRESL